MRCAMVRIAPPAAVAIWFALPESNGHWEAASGRRSATSSHVRYEYCESGGFFAVAWRTTGWLTTAGLLGPLRPSEKPGEADAACAANASRASAASMVRGEDFTAGDLPLVRDPGHR